MPVRGQRRGPRLSTHSPAVWSGFPDMLIDQCRPFIVPRVIPWSLFRLFSTAIFPHRETSESSIGVFFVHSDRFSTRCSQFQVWESAVPSVFRKDRSPRPCVGRRASSSAKERVPYALQTPLVPLLVTVNLLYFKLSRPSLYLIPSSVLRPIEVCTPGFSVGCDKGFRVQAAAQGTFHWKGKSRGQRMALNIVVFAGQRAHAVLSHVLLAILKCPVHVLMENCLLDTRRVPRSKHFPLDPHTPGF